jgi:hypothetical protein
MGATVRFLARGVVVLAAGIIGVGAAVALGTAESSLSTCEQSVSEALLSNRIVAPSQSYRKDNPNEYAAVRAYLDGGARPTGSLTHMGLHLVALEDTCRDLAQTTTTTITTTTTTTTTTPPPTGTANLWVDVNGGTCVRTSGGPYMDAQSCPTFDAAWDKASASDVIRVRPGTYAGQNITGSKTAVTKIIGEDGVVISGATSGFCSYGPGTGLMQITADFVWLENMRIDSGTAHGQGTGGCIEGANVTYRNVDLYGAFVALYPVGQNFTWNGGQHGAPGVTGGPYALGDGEPVWIESSAHGATLDGITFNPKRIASGFHLENVRIQTANNVTLRNLRFLAGSDAGSGHVFITAASSGRTITGLRLESNIFEPVIGTYAIQTHTNVATGQSWVIRSNRFDQPVTMPASLPGLIACGNTGQVPVSWQSAC